MRLFGYISCYFFFAVGLIFYFTTWRTIHQLVAETRTLKPGARFSGVWLLPAWKLHRSAYPASPLRKRIVARFGLTFLLMLLATICLEYAQIHGRL